MFARYECIAWSRELRVAHNLIAVGEGSLERLDDPAECEHGIVAGSTEVEALEDL
jgi:hypothetical protein